jgi:hypothetical protein
VCSPREEGACSSGVLGWAFAERLWSGTEKAVRTERPGRGVTIKRDALTVP